MHRPSVQTQPLLVARQHFSMTLATSPLGQGFEPIHSRQQRERENDKNKLLSLGTSMNDVNKRWCIFWSYKKMIRAVQRDADQIALS